ncbi:hypothetical protein [Streptomyces sp. NPDC058855]|uniref:hypothetical protein n=1 Tax=Streptomyces sp. NPDC058855 TaxID=3346651 RepID=UPI0036A79050
MGVRPLGRTTATARRLSGENLHLQRAAAEIGLADPDPGDIPWIRQRLIDAAHHSEQLIDSLLLLATTDQGLEHRNPYPWNRPRRASRPTSPGKRTNAASPSPPPPNPPSWTATPCSSPTSSATC